MNRPVRRIRTVLLALAVALPLLVGAAPGTDPVPPAAQDGAPPAVATAGGFLVYLDVDSPLCVLGAGFNVTNAPYFVTDDCGFANFTLNGVPEGAAVTGELVGPDGETQPVEVTGPDDAGEGRATLDFDEDSPVGELDLRILVDGVEAGRTQVFHNMLRATIDVPGDLEPGDDIPVSGTIEAVDAQSSDLLPPDRTGVPATFDLAVRLPDGTSTTALNVTAEDDGSFSETVPGSHTAALTPADGELTMTASVDVVDAVHDDGGTTWRAGRAGSAPLPLSVPPSSLQLEASFTSSTGWVKPGDTFPFRVTVTNATGAPVDAAVVTMTTPDAVTFTDAVDLNDAGAVDQASDRITWDLGEVAAGTPGAPTVETLVVEASAADLAADPEVVWKDLSVAATLAEGGTDIATSTTHGPKVVPPSGEFDTARYGDKPFPIVPVDYTDRGHEAHHTGDELSRVINSPDEPGSTFNLYQEMSYGQLFPQGTVPSSGIATASFQYEPGFDFTTPERVGSTCRGFTFAEIKDLSLGSNLGLDPERIVDGWYQLPGDTEYYGGDFPAFTLGTGSTIDGACGPTGKSVYDAAVIADPEIDYDDFDSDKDGVVDFFMMVFNGLGGNGVSQTSVPPYDNIWPHSSSLELDFRDPETGLRGYVTDDQLTSKLGVPQCWTDESYTQSDDCAAEGTGGTGDDDLPTFVRVGPYNVNPESAIDAASVISHEYGHHLGLPDFYSGGATGNPYYDSMNLMASDHSQHMTVFGKQELGWVVPHVIQPGEEVAVDDWSEIKTDTGQIHWETPDGTPYTLSEAGGDQNVHNGQAYTVKLPQEQIIDPDKVAEQASAPHVFWSGRGNDFGCSPAGGHNMDLLLPELADLEPGTEVELSFRSNFDIEWDWDYGFVLTSTDGEEYTSVGSAEGYTTGSAFNPNNAGCLNELDNGLTGTSTAHEQGEPFVTAARNPVAADYSGDHPFLTDRYDISSLAGEVGARLRFSYFTDAAFDRPGWFVDDIVVTADGEELVRIDGSDHLEGRVFQGGCDRHRQVSAVCTAGWQVVDATATNPADHGYYLELRDRALFDYDGNGQSDRGMPDWEPGVFIEYTDESHGYGNNGVPPPPAQHYLDSMPVPGAGCDTTTCEDSAFQAVEGRDHFDDDGWVDNHADDTSDDGNWHFDYDCLTLDVTDMSGQGAAAGNPDLVADATIRAGSGCRAFSYSPSGSSGDDSGSGDDDSGTGDDSGGVAGDQAGPDATARLFGGDRVETSVVLSAQAFDSADTAVLARADDFPDALTAATLAAEVDGPILLTDSSGLDGRVRDELDRLGAETVYLTGGDQALSPQVADDVEAAGMGHERLAGPDRFATAVAIAQEVVDLGGQLDGAIVALGARPDGRDAFPDALAASQLATRSRQAVLLATPDTLPDSTRTAMDGLLTSDAAITIAGGPVAISEQVEDELSATGRTVDRVEGGDRYETATKLADGALQAGAAGDTVWVVSGTNFPDALAAGSAAYASDALIVLTDPRDLSANTRTWLQAHADTITRAVIVGGPVAISEAVDALVRAAIR